jgi:hypothetical protein
VGVQIQRNVAEVQIARIREKVELVLGFDEKFVGKRSFRRRR